MKNIIFGSLTDRGLTRPENEDNLGYTPTPNGDLFVVCDGMGGHLGGKVASSMAVDSIIQFFTTQKYENPIIALKEALEFANKQVFEKSLADKSLRGMGTTVCILLYQPDNKVFIAHVGDSRIYINSSGRLLRLTKDHSYVQQLVDQGIISDSQAEKHPQKNQLMQALGTMATIRPTIPTEPILPKNGDLFMICSDGLCGLVNDMTLQEITKNNDIDVHKMAHILVNTAKNAGGTDNITVQIIKVTESQHSKSVFAHHSTEGVRITADPVETTNAALTTEEPDSKQVEKTNNENLNEAEGVKNGNKKKNRILALSLLYTVIISLLVFLAYFFLFSEKYLLISYKDGLATDTVQLNSKEAAIEMAETQIKNQNENFVVCIFKTDRSGKIIGNSVTEMRGSGGKPFAIFIFDESENVHRAKDFFDTEEDAQNRFPSYIDDYSTYNGYTVKLLKKDSKGEFSTTIKWQTIEYEEPTPITKPSLFIQHKVAAGETWISLYNKYGVCPCYIIKVTSNIQLDTKGNPVKGAIYMIPKHYSAKMELNPTNFEKYSTDKVGYVNGECTKLEAGTCRTKVDNTVVHSSDNLIIKHDTVKTTPTTQDTTKNISVDNTKVTNNTSNELSEKDKKKQQLISDIATLTKQIQELEVKKNTANRQEKKTIETQISELTAKREAKQAELKKLK